MLKGPGNIKKDQAKTRRHGVHGDGGLVRDLSDGGGAIIMIGVGVQGLGFRVWGLGVCYATHTHMYIVT